jgi:hypothetical protein
MRRSFVVLLVVTLAAFTVVGILAFTHTFAILTDDKRCFAGFLHAQWPKWIGCAISAHENLSGGLIGAAGTILAAYIAWMAVDNQNEVQREIAGRNHTEAITAIRADMQRVLQMCRIVWTAVDHGLSENAAFANGAVNAVALMAAELKDEENIRPQILELGNALSVAKRRDLARLLVAIRVFAHDVDSGVAGNPAEYLHALRRWLTLIAEKAKQFDPALAAIFLGLIREDDLIVAPPPRSQSVPNNFIR